MRDQLVYDPVDEEEGDPCGNKETLVPERGDEETLKLKESTEVLILRLIIVFLIFVLRGITVRTGRAHPNPCNCTSLAKPLDGMATDFQDARRAIRYEQQNFTRKTLLQ